MDLQLSTAHLRFRNELRAWLAAHLPRPWREELRDPRATETSLIELRRAWQKKLYQAGYLGMDWPEDTEPPCPRCVGSTGNSLVDEAADFPGPQAQSIAGTVQLSR